MGRFQQVAKWNHNHLFTNYMEQILKDLLIMPIRSFWIYNKCLDVFGYLQAFDTGRWIVSECASISLFGKCWNPSPTPCLTLKHCCERDASGWASEKVHERGVEAKAVTGERCTVIGYRWWFYVCLCWCSSQNCARWIHFYKWQKDTNSSRWQDETIFTWAHCLNTLVKKTPATLVISAWEDDLKVPSKGPSLLPCTWWTSRPNRTWKVRKYKVGGSMTKGMKKKPMFLRFVFF